MKKEFKNIKCDNEVEFKYLLRFYELDKIPIFYNKIPVGYMTKDLEYEKGMGKYFNNYSDALNCAIVQLPKYIAAVQKFKSKEKISLTTVYYSDYKPMEEKIISGTYDDIFAQIESANDHLRYCNGSYYKFKDNSDEELSNLWYKYIPENRKMDMYYGNGTVD